MDPLPRSHLQINIPRKLLEIRATKFKKGAGLHEVQSLAVANNDILHRSVQCAKFVQGIGVCIRASGCNYTTKIELYKLRFSGCF